MTDWAFATQIAGIGFLTVFLVLSILSFILWLVSLLIFKTVGKSKAEEATEKAK